MLEQERREMEQREIQEIQGNFRIGMSELHRTYRKGVITYRELLEKELEIFRAHSVQLGDLLLKL